MIVELFTRPGCHLCHDARAVIQEAARHFKFELRERNVEEDAAWESSFGQEIPVVLIDGRKQFKYRVSLPKLLRVLARAASKRRR